MTGRWLFTFFVGFVVLAVVPRTEAAKQLTDRTVERFVGVAEWSLSAEAVAGNPFDLLATVIFTHTGSGETRVTEMFFAGDATWRFRFSGTRTGLWTFRTRSEHRDLDGWVGTVRVTPDMVSSGRGFVGARGNHWAWQGSGDVFVPQLVMIGGDKPEAGPALYDQREEVDALIGEFVRWHGFTGFHVNRLAGFWFYKEGDIAVNPNRRNPDPATFAALELLISRAHAAGAMVHIWVWGDEARGETPLSLAEGINGAVDRRLQRYIAARLGALPGWSMGYGFDLYEWVDEDELHAWHAFMQRRLGWPHLLGGRPQSPWSGTDHTAEKSWNDALSYSSYEHHRPGYKVYLAAMADGLNQPVLSEDRFRVRAGDRAKDYTEADTRRGLWRSTLAGGVGNIWGQLETDEQENATGIYRNRQQLKTYSTFFFGRDRFLPGMRPVQSITDGLALVTPDDANYVFYRETADSLRLDLSGASATTEAIAVDTRDGYTEVNLGVLAKSEQLLTLSHVSDWAVAVGPIATRGAGKRLGCVPEITGITSVGSAVSIIVTRGCSGASAVGLKLHGFDPISAHGGRIRFAGPGVLSYTPPPWYDGPDTFGYTVDTNDGVHSVRVQVGVHSRGRQIATLLAFVLGVSLVVAVYRRWKHRLWR